MTGVTTSSYLTSEDPDLEDGEIASDEEGGKSPQPHQAQTKDTSRRNSHSTKEKKDEDRHKSDQNERRGKKSRSSQPSQDEPERKKKKTNEEGENSENEGDLLGVRGGSPDLDLNAPIWKPKATGHMDTPWSDEGEDRKRRHGSSPGDRRAGNNFRSSPREDRETRARIQVKRKLKTNRKGVADKEVCVSYLKGLCNKGADCFYSHNVCQPRKMELCKFFLKDCCTKRDRCLYLHEEFPCKFFHTGLTCYANKKCKFNHEPLTNFTRDLLLKHGQQKENCGDFPLGNECIENNRIDDLNQIVRKHEQMDQSRRDIDHRIESDEKGFKEDPDANNSWRDDDNQKPINFPGQMEDLPNQRGGGSQDVNDHRHSSPANRRRDRSPDRRFGHNDRSPDNRFNRGNRNSPDNRFGRGSRGRNEREDNNRRRGDQDERRNRNDDRNNRNDDRNNRNDDHGRNFGPRNFNDGPDNRDFNRGNRNNLDGPGRGPHDNRDNFDPESPRKRNFGPDGPTDNRNDNRHRNFGPDCHNMQNFGGNNNNNNLNFGPGGPNIPNFGQNDFNFHQNGPMNFNSNGPNFGPNGPNNFGFNNEPNFNSNNMNNQNFMQNGPNFNQNGPNFNQNIPNLMSSGPNFGPNQDNFRNNRDFRNDGAEDRRFDNNNKKRDQWLDDRDRNIDPKIRRRSDGSPRRTDRNDDEKEKERRGNEKKEKHSKRGSDNNDQGESDRHKVIKPKPIVDDESNNSGTSSPFDFAKELAEYKNKKMEMDSIKVRHDHREFIEPKSEPQPEILQKPKLEIKEEPEVEFPPKFTQVYPPFPEPEPTKSKNEKDSSSKKHHHHKKKRKHSEGEEHEKNKKSRKEKKEKKRTPVIISEDGGFGGIKFKIKLNQGKDEKREVTSNRRHNEFMSSDDEIPLNCLQKKKDKEDGDETDTESRLVIETNDDPDEVLPPKIETDDSHYPRHLPKRQQELFMRIQSHQNDNFAVEDNSRRSGSPGDRTPTPEPVDQNWYSSDEETAENTQNDNNPLKIVESKIKLSEIASNELEELERSTTPPGPPPVAEHKIELAALKDLSKINITELLSSIRQITGIKSQTSAESSPDIQPNLPPTRPEPEKKDPRARDPRMGGLSPQGGSISPKYDEPKNRRSSAEEKPPYAKSIYDLSTVPENKGLKDLDMRFQMDVDHRTPESHFGDVDLRMLGDGPLPPLKLGLPFKPAPMHLAATEIEASLASHPHIDYKVHLICVPPPDFSSIKISPNDPLVKKDPRLRRLFRVSSVDDPKQEEPKKQASGPVDPRRKATVSIADTPKSPPSTPFSPPQETARLPQSIITLVQLGISAATGAFDPRLRSLVPQDLEALRAAVAGIRPEDLEAIKALDKPQIPQIPTEPQRPPGLLPTPGLGLLPTPPSFMMNNLMDPMMVGNMGPMGQPMPGSLMGPMPSLMNQPVPPFPFGEPPMNDADMRIFRGGFKGDRRGGRNNWRGNPRDRNWDNRRRDNWDERDRGRRDKDRRDHLSKSPPA